MCFLLFLDIVLGRQAGLWTNPMNTVKLNVLELIQIKSGDGSGRLVVERADNDADKLWWFAKRECTQTEIEKKNQKFKKKEMNCASDRPRHLADGRFVRRHLQEFWRLCCESTSLGRIGEKCGQRPAIFQTHKPWTLAEKQFVMITM